MGNAYERSWAGLQDMGIVHALAQIEDTFGVQTVIKDKALLKFGKASVGTSYETVQDQGGNETYVSTNAIDSISSDDAGDTNTMVVEGHTIDGSGNLTFTVQTVTLTGQTRTALTTPLARATRLYNNSDTEFSGTIYVYENTALTGGAPTDTTKIHVQADASHQQSLKASTSISQYDYWIITQFFGSVDKKSAATVTFQVQVRGKDGVFRTQLTGSTGAGASPAFVTVDPPFLVPSNSDVRIRAISSSTATEVSAWMNGYLAIDKDQVS
jgi:hypothetical protein